MEIRILTATPGLNKTRLLEKVKQFVTNLKVSNRQASVGIGEVEEKLVEICPEELYFKDEHQDQLALILGQLPQDKVRDLWKDALDLAVEDATAGCPDLALIVTSFSYYRGETFEFYCPADPHYITKPWDSIANGPPDGS